MRGDSMVVVVVELTRWGTWGEGWCSEEGRTCSVDGRGMGEDSERLR